MKMFHLICYLILLLVRSAESRPAPGGYKDTSVVVNASSDTAIFKAVFGVLEMDHNSVRLNLTQIRHKPVVNVINNTPDVDVRWQGPHQLLIHKENTSVEYEVRVNSVEASKDKLIISLEDNGERVEIYINYEFFPWPPLDSFRGTVMRACIIFLVMFGVIKAVHSQPPYEPNEIKQPRSCITEKQSRHESKANDTPCSNEAS